MKNMVIVMIILNKDRPFKFSKIKGYAQSVVIVRENTVQTMVRNTVQKNAFMYLMSPNTME